MVTICTTCFNRCYLEVVKSALCIYVFRTIPTVNSDYFLKQR
jgi:hypothetical protein